MPDDGGLWKLYKILNLIFKNESGMHFGTELLKEIMDT